MPLTRNESIREARRHAREVKALERRNEPNVKALINKFYKEFEKEIDVEQDTNSQKRKKINAIINNNIGLIGIAGVTILRRVRKNNILEDLTQLKKKYYQDYIEEINKNILLNVNKQNKTTLKNMGKALAKGRAVNLDHQVRTTNNFMTSYTRNDSLFHNKLIEEHVEDVKNLRTPPKKLAKIAIQEPKKAFPKIRTFKSWVYISDGKARETHTEVQDVLITDPFEVGGELLMYPRDIGGSPAETYNCRCSVSFFKG